MHNKNHPSYFRKNVSLKDYSSWKVGGLADLFFEPESTEQLIEGIQYFNTNKIPWFLIGNGTNILFDDDGIRGAIIKLGNSFNKIEIKDDILIAGAATFAPCIAKKAADNGFSGIEHIVGIPATLGGLVTMNGGSLRQNISTNIKYVKALNNNYKLITLKADECNFSYRKSLFQEKKWVIIEVGLTFNQKKEPQIIKKEMLDILQKRNEKFPRKLPNCGSVFQSTPEVYEKFGAPGKIIEDLGLKGYQIGGAKISEKHANFIINTGKAKSKDIKQLIRVVNEKIYYSHKFILKIEPQIIKPYEQ